MTKPTAIIVIITALVCFMGLTGQATADQICACYQKEHGQLRIVNNHSECLESELPIFLTGAAWPCDKSIGQTVFVPAACQDLSFYDAEGNLLLNQISITQLYVRNADLEKSVVLTSVKFYDPDGNLVKEYLEEPQVIAPLASVTFLASPSVSGVELYDQFGGRPSFVVQWQANDPVVPAHIGMNGMVMRPGDVPGTWETHALAPGLGKVIKERRIWQIND